MHSTKYNANELVRVSCETLGKAGIAQGRSQGFEKGGSTKNFLSAPVSILAKSS